MKLILITPSFRTETFEYLERAAQELQIPVIELVESSSIPTLDPIETYLIYNIAISPEALKLEEDVFRKYYCVALANPLRNFYDQIQVFNKTKIAFLPTKHIQSSDSDEIIIKKCNEIGFPIIIKAKVSGGYGKGVIKANDSRSCLDIIHFLFDNGEKKFVVQQFISHCTSNRVTILHDKVIAATRHQQIESDFRTNSRTLETNIEQIKLSSYFQKAIVKAAQSLGLFFGGADAIIDDANNSLFITEINFPCHYLRREKHTDIPISKMMLSYLQSKTKYQDSFEKLTFSSNKKARLVLINKNTNSTTLHIIKKTAARFGFETLDVDPDKPLPHLSESESYLIYTISSTALHIEKQLMDKFNCTSLTSNYVGLDNPDLDKNAHFDSNKIPSINKIILLKDDIDVLHEQTQKLGDFPLVIQIWDSKKIDFLKVDNFQSFISLFDYVRAKKKYASIQPYIEVQKFMKCIVLDGKVIASLWQIPKEGDAPFMVLGKDYFNIPWELSKKAQNLAVKAAKSLKLDFAEVLLVEDMNGKIFIQEVYHPPYFYDVQVQTNINIAEQMLFALAKKSISQK